VSTRIAGAPISWGVCEVPDWGYQLPAERVLPQLHQLGLQAMEFGPAGFLPSQPSRLRALLAEYDLQAVGGFEPVVLHTGDADPLAGLADRLDAYVATGADTMVLAAVTGRDGYESRPELDGQAWARLLTGCDRIADRAADVGIRAVLHPHVGTLVESAADIARVLAGARIGLCLDTGHLTIGGVDPVEFATTAGKRIAHVHCKDVDAGLATAVRSGTISYTRAVRDGLYRPLGRGDVDIEGVCRALRAAGYEGWWVLEQDRMLPMPDFAPDTPSGTPADVAAITSDTPTGIPADVAADVTASLSFLQALL